MYIVIWTFRNAINSHVHKKCPKRVHCPTRLWNLISKRCYDCFSLLFFYHSWSITSFICFLSLFLLLSWAYTTLSSFLLSRVWRWGRNFSFSYYLTSISIILIIQHKISFWVTILCLNFSTLRHGLYTSETTFNVLINHCRQFSLVIKVIIVEMML